MTDPFKAPPGPGPKHLPAPLNIPQLQAELARLVASPGPASPIRYIQKTRGEARARTSSTTAPQPRPTTSTSGSTTTTTTAAKTDANPNDPTLAAHCLPVLTVHDILHHSPRDRAVHWLSRALVRDDLSMVFQEDIYTYYTRCFTPHFSIEPGQGILDPRELMENLLKIFKGVRADDILTVKTEDGRGLLVMRNLAWRGQPPRDARAGGDGEQQVYPLDVGVMGAAREDGSASSVTARGPGETNPFVAALPENDHIPYTIIVTAADRDAGRKLAHIPEPARTRLWLRMFYEHGDNVEVEEMSMWLFYEGTFHPFSDTAPHLEGPRFVDLISRVFKRAEAVEVGPEYHVIWGLKPRATRRKASEMLRHYAAQRKERTIRQLERMDARHDFNLRVEDHDNLNMFQELLFLSPVLSLPAGQPSPWLQRLRRRANGGSLGDHQVGFPGVSMKKLSREYRQDCEEAKKLASERIKRASKEAGLASEAVDQVIDHVLDPHLESEMAGQPALTTDATGAGRPDSAVQSLLD
ncbi:hypothetical protein LTR08_004515 [Meristemomyces frigidus]|nr:hypothetical protein LTR08_004515 [Meristemomyces frigidus]